MPLFEIVFEGVFEIVNQDSAHNLPAGFYTTRFMKGIDKDDAIDRGKANILEEISREFQGIALEDISLRVDSCRKVTSFSRVKINRGFTFYSEK